MNKVLEALFAGIGKVLGMGEGIVEGISLIGLIGAVIGLGTILYIFWKYQWMSSVRDFLDEHTKLDLPEWMYDDPSDEEFEIAVLEIGVYLPTILCSIVLSLALTNYPISVEGLNIFAHSMDFGNYSEWVGVFHTYVWCMIINIIVTIAVAGIKFRQNSVFYKIPLAIVCGAGLGQLYALFRSVSAPYLLVFTIIFDVLEYILMGGGVVVSLISLLISLGAYIPWVTKVYETADKVFEAVGKVMDNFSLPEGEAPDPQDMPEYIHDEYGEGYKRVEIHGETAYYENKFGKKIYLKPTDFNSDMDKAEKDFVHYRKD